MAGLKVLLWRYTGQQDVSVGTVTAGRSRRELEELVGLFVNTLVIRSEVRGEESFEGVLEGVREASLGAQGHEEVPFEKLVDELGVERDPSRTPLFQVMCVLQNAPEGDLTLPGVVVEEYGILGAAAKCDLTLECFDSPEGLDGHFVYSADLFERSTVERMAGHLEMLLGAIASAPELPVRELPLLTEREWEQLREWNRTELAHACRPAPELFEEQARRQPDAVALACADEELTYGELNERANRLAHHLVALGVRRESRVGVCLERTPELVVALMGVLKAGGAYVPLDPGYPAERLALMLGDSGAGVLLTQSALRGLLPDPGAEVVELDVQAEAIAARSEEDLALRIEPAGLAHVIYTSGSTGRPKGVAIEHRNVSELVHWASATVGRDELCGMLASTSVCFD